MSPGDPLNSRPSATLFPTKSSPNDYLYGRARNGLASEMCRSVNLINAGYAVHYLDEQEAWDRLMENARLAQGSFSSWQELSTDFLGDWQLRAADLPFYTACAQLCSIPTIPTAPGIKIPGKTDLSDATKPK